MFQLLLRLRVCCRRGWSNAEITGSAVALPCCKTHAKINRKIENSTPCKIVTHEDFNLKLGTHDYVADITHHATLGSNPPSGGFPPNRGNITLLWLFGYTGFSIDPDPRSNRRTDSYAEWLKWRVSAQGWSFWGSGQWVTSYWENIPQKLPKRGVSRQFQAKTPKFLHRNISGTINPTNYRFEIGIQTTKGTSLVVRHYPKANTTWLTAAVLKIDMTSYFRSGCSDLDEIRQPDAEWHADYGEMVEIETGSRIPIWRTFVFRNRK